MWLSAWQSLIGVRRFFDRLVVPRIRFPSGHLDKAIRFIDQQLPAAQLMDTLVTPIEFDPDIIHTNRENSTSVLHRFAP